MLISDKLPVRKSYFDSSIIQNENARILRHFSKDYFEVHVDRRTCLHATHQGVKVEHFDVSNVIYHKFSHGAVSYTLNGKNVNDMLELKMIFDCCFCINSTEYS